MDDVIGACGDGPTCQVYAFPCRLMPGACFRLQLKEGILDQLRSSHFLTYSMPLHSLDGSNDAQPTSATSSSN